ncbi:hypothetical protein P4U23_16310 [Aeribacillus composti]|uniref:hypothetical protein n=1 Tax=Aeribacillus composti TaxID=1868734 RepID=UPI002E1AF032|nr:hypothetical protein [Aeribacillus composti]
MRTMDDQTVDKLVLNGNCVVWITAYSIDSFQVTRRIEACSVTIRVIGKYKSLYE